jgi:putative membrane protein
MMFLDHGFMGGFMWIFWIAVIVGLAFLIKWIFQQNRPSESRLEEKSLEILKKRYANGEIGRDEFMKKRKDLLS